MFIIDKLGNNSTASVTPESNYYLTTNNISIRILNVTTTATERNAESPTTTFSNLTNGRATEDNAYNNMAPPTTVKSTEQGTQKCKY